MVNHPTRWRKCILLGRKYGFILSVVGSTLTIILGCLRLYYYEFPALADLDFHGFVLGYMRPDTGLADDLKQMGFKNFQSKSIGMATFDWTMGDIQNRGRRDVTDLEIKLSAGGNLRVAQVAGLLGPVNGFPLEPDEPEG